MTASAGPPLSVNAPGPPALVVTGSYTGYAEVRLDRPVDVDGWLTTIVRTGRYAGVVLGMDEVAFTSDDMPDPSRLQHLGLPRTLGPGAFRVYLFTEPGKAAVVTIPWGGPSTRVAVTHEVNGAFAAKRAPDAGSGEPVKLAPYGGTPNDYVWAAGYYERHWLNDGHNLVTRVCITRRASCDRYAILSNGANGGGTGSVAVATDEDVRTARPIALATSDVDGAAAALDSFTVWSLRLAISPGYRLPLHRRTSEPVLSRATR